MSLKDADEQLMIRGYVERMKRAKEKRALLKERGDERTQGPEDE